MSTQAIRAVALALFLGFALAANTSAAPVPSGTGGALRAGIAEKALRIPVGAPLGGYLRPPILGDAFFGDESPFRAIFDFYPTGIAHDGTPLQPVPDELRTIHSPFATYSPPSRGYYDSLIAKAVALHDGERWAVLVKTDFIGMLDELVVAVTDRVLGETGIDLGDGLILSANHSHDGPGALANHSVRYFWLAMDVYQPELFERVVAQLSALVIEALEATVPARFGYGIGTEVEAAGIRKLNSFRRTRAPYPAERIDQQNLLRRRIGVLRLDEVDPSTGDVVGPLAVIVNYAAHGIAFDVENLFFSGDVLASVEREVENAFDQPMLAMLIQSAAGDVSPRTDGGPALQRIERFGKLLAPQVLDVYGSINAFDSAPEIRAVSQRVILDREHLGYVGDEYPYEWGAAQCNALDAAPGQCLRSPPPDPHLDGRGENGAFVPTDTRVSALRIGSAVLLAQPGEALVEYGLQLLEASPFGPENTFIWGYSQDHVGYILPDLREDWLLGGTEATTTFWGWKLGGRLLHSSRALMASLDPADGSPAPEHEILPIYQSIPYVPALATPSLRPGSLQLQPRDVRRLSSTRFAFEGGDPVLDLPVVTLERQRLDGAWEPAKRPNGEVIADFFEMHLRYTLMGGTHQWRVDFEAPIDWPLGTYRFRAVGEAVSIAAPTGDRYEALSAPFTVLAANTLELSLIAIEAIGEEEARLEFELAYPAHPDNYRVIDPVIPSDRNAPVRSGKVTVTISGQEYVDASPELLERDGNLVAVFRVDVQLAEASLDTVVGEDLHGNHSP